jgi:hypothetical protein
MHETIVVKMDNSDLLNGFKKCFIKGRHLIMKSINMVFFYMYACIDIVVHFAMDSIIMKHHKQYTCL